MKKLLIGIFALGTLSAFAQNNSQFEGEYKLIGAKQFRDGVADFSLKAKGTARIDKDASSYFASLETNVLCIDGVELTKETNSLKGTGETECDDPGCCYFTEINVAVKKAKMKVDYIGYCHNEEAEEEYSYEEVNGTLKFSKK